MRTVLYIRRISRSPISKLSRRSATIGVCVLIRFLSGPVRRYPRRVTFSRLSSPFQVRRFANDFFVRLFRFAVCLGSIRW